jgi:hypothetical protein
LTLLRLLALAIVIWVAVLAASTRLASGATTGCCPPTFMSPSGNVVCMVYNLGTTVTIVGCYVRHQHRVVALRGHNGRPTISSQKNVNGYAPTLPHGHFWKHNGLVCESTPAGINCWNLPAHHGFLIGRAGIHTY